MGRKKPKSPRNWTAVSAKFRNSAGSMGDDKKEKDLRECRDFDPDEVESEYEDELPDLYDEITENDLDHYGEWITTGEDE